MAARQPPIAALTLIMVGAVTLHAMAPRLWRGLSVATTIHEILDGKVAPGQAVAITRAVARLPGALRVRDLDARDARGEKVYRYVLAHDRGSDRAMVVLIWRTTFPQSESTDEGIITDLRGTVKPIPDGERARLEEAFPDRAVGATLFLDEMEFASVPVSLVLLLVVAIAAIAAGFIALVRTYVGGRSARTVGPHGVVAASHPRAPRQENRRSCPSCGTESPVASRACVSCYLPVEAEYYVAANLPFEGFARFVPIFAGVLKVGEYQATQPLARVHTPLPFNHLESFHAKGPSATAPFRLAARGIASLVSAQAVASALEEKGLSAQVIGSQELAAGPFARRAFELRYDEQSVTFGFEVGADRDERTVLWSRVALVLFSAAQPLRGTMTIARDVRQGGAPDPNAYLIDLYEYDVAEGIRIAEGSFHRWEFLKAGALERPADRYGRLIELLESRARTADFQFLSGVYKGARNEWRTNYYSRFCYLIGEKTRWARHEGPPRLDGYEVLEKLGEGGMGSVYLAKQKKLGRMVALKVISGNLAAEERFIKRFQAEAQAVAQLSHPNIVQVIDLAESNGRHFIVMEYVEGKTLLKQIKERGRLGEVESLRIGQQVAAALDHACRRGIVHRDVKPENVFLTPSGGAKLGDWGLAKDLERDLGLTDTGTAVGTPYYMSPEQARGRRDLDVRSDLYALGATIFHAMAGVPPYRGGSPGEVIAKHLQAPVPDVRVLSPEVSADTARLLTRLLAKRPDDRFADAEEAMRAIAQALRGAEMSSLILT